MKNEKILDLGCGKYKIKNAIGMDFCDIPNIDVVHDLNSFPYPFKDNSFDEIHCYHILEHLNDVISVMQELYRIGKSGGKVFIRVPHASCSKSLWIDPTHKRGFTCRTFLDYFNKDAKFGYYSNTDFVVKKQKLNYCLYDGSRGTNIPRIIQIVLNTMANINSFSQELWERILVNYVGGFEELYVELEIRKSCELVK